MERERLLKNISSKETEIKAVEVKRTQGLFEQEKEMTRIRMRNQDIEGKVLEWQNKYQESERKREMLMRENERLKGINIVGKKQMGNS